MSAVWKDEDMPVSQHGVRADVLITAASPFNRMNCGQFYEQFITLCSSIVADRVRREIPPDKAYDYIMDYIQEINPNFAKMIAEDLNTQALRDDFVEACKEDGIYLVIPPFCNSINPDLVLRLSKKYGIERGPISYYRTHSDGTREHIVTKHDGLIGSKYMVLLGKRPGDALAATELGYVNQFSTPMKANGKWAKMQCLHSQTPQKYGEDEMGNLIVILGVIAAARISGVYSNSTVALNALAEKLLTDPHPSALKNNGMTTAEVVKTCSNIGLFQHMLAAIGYTIKENP